MVNVTRKKVLKEMNSHIDNAVKKARLGGLFGLSELDMFEEKAQTWLSAEIFHRSRKEIEISYLFSLLGVLCGYWCIVALALLGLSGKPLYSLLILYTLMVIGLKYIAKPFFKKQVNEEVEKSHIFQKLFLKIREEDQNGTAEHKN